ncbi:hypothetical protein GPECTOR_939g195 [Gonium pectorale]|uniref:Uncharacterized protein n=1 Tax=Gonium pectorale TaxID=33097 RepID=A0A150FV20_GONPE|nr:hypothetical protein GPECTOR_939g195 [Gonium pectorale]|eukprot:KXZ41035.1 hypothetical protein GPECTOR_939g195 [Gonium pectorale]
MVNSKTHLIRCRGAGLSFAPLEYLTSAVLDGSPHMLTVVAFERGEWRVTRQNARSRAWLGDLTALSPAASPLPPAAAPGTGGQRYEDALLRLFSADPAALDAMLAAMGASTSGTWQGALPGRPAREMV